MVVPSNFASEFSSCEFHSIDEFSLDKSNIQIRHMDFDNKEPRKIVKNKPKIEERKIDHIFEYNQNMPTEKRNRDRALRKPEGHRKVLNVEPQVKESKISYIIKDISSYEKSVEAPSSFLEPSIVFDEKEGKGGLVNNNNVNKYRFNSIFSKHQKTKPSILENKLTDGTQILPKDNESESVIACSISDVNSNEQSMSDHQSRNGKIDKQPSDYWEKTKPKKEETKKKHKLKDYITQVDQKQTVKPIQAKLEKDKKSKTAHKQDSKITNKGKGHGSTGGVDSSHAPSDEEAVPYEDLTQEACKGRDFVDENVLMQQEAPEEPDSANAFSDVHKMHMIQTLQGLLFIRSLPEVSQEEIDSKKVFLPPPDSPHKKKVIVFDLDETLVHCMEEFEQNEVDHVLTIEFPNNEVVDAGLNIRPYAIECLKEANKHFQVIVFTASHSCYADAVLDFIDPHRELIQYRMYRDQWVETPQGIFIKDLRMIANRDLKDVLLVDNASYSFGYQLDNGIPIIPFYNDKNDKELLHLIQYLKWVIDSEDVRDQNRKAFQLGELSEQEITEYLNLYAANDSEEAEGEDDEEEEEK